MSDAQTLQDEDGFHEIQLNGKQLVFLGMTTTLVSVVIFLCGVLVGRGVKPLEPVAEAATAHTEPAQTVVADPAPAPAPETPAAETPAPAPAPVAATVAAAAPPTPAVAPAPTEAPRAEPTPAASKPQAQAAARTTAEPAPVDELSYYDALSKGAKSPAAKNAAKKGGSTDPVAKTPESAPKPTPAAAPPAPAVAAASPASAPAASLPKGGAIAVQVAALTSRADAESIARRLTSKGYAAYVLTPDPGAKAVFKVRVGNYASADEAARVSRRLKQEEKLQPWVIR